MREVEAAIVLNPPNPGLIGGASNMIAAAEECERALELVNEALRLNPYYPLSFKFTEFWCRFCAGDYRRALSLADALAVGVYIGPMLRAATLGWLGRLEEATTELARAYEAWPEFAADPPAIIRRAFVFDDNVKRLLTGLHAAGLPPTTP